MPYYYTDWRGSEEGKHMPVREYLYDYRDLAQAYLNYKKELSLFEGDKARYEKLDKETQKSRREPLPHKDLLHYEALYNGLSAALDIDVANSNLTFLFFLSSMETTYNGLFNPFGISLEGPGEVDEQQFKVRHGNVPRLIISLQDALIGMLTDALIDRHGPNKTVTQEELEAAGFNPSKTPRSSIYDI